MEQLFITIFSILTIAIQALLAILGILWLIGKTAHAKLYDQIKQIIKQYGLIILFLVPTAAMAGSLIFSKIIGFEPCELCWYQRMFLYPQAMLAAAAIIRKKKDIIPYLALLSVFGAIISAYQYVNQMATYYGSSRMPLLCISDAVSCSEIYFLQFGYITIPLMTFTAFILILIISLIAKKTQE